MSSLQMIGSSTEDNSPPTLLTIPGELRNRIYELVLLEDSKVYPFDYRPCSCECPKHKRHAPNVALLCVNRQINHEATPILYSRATFRLSTGYHFMKFMAVGDVCMYGFPAASDLYPSRNLIRSLRVKFVPEHMPSEVRSGHIMGCWSDPHFQLMSKKQRAQIIHRYNRSVCQTVWTNAGKVITMIRDLKFLSIDVEEVFCPQGCCRMVGHVMRSLRGLRKKEGFTVAVTGELKDEEKRMVLKGLKYRGPSVQYDFVKNLFEGGEGEDEDAEDYAYHEEGDEDHDEEDEDHEEENEDNEEEAEDNEEEDENVDDKLLHEEDDAEGTSGTDTGGSNSDDSKNGREFPDRH